MHAWRAQQAQAPAVSPSRSPLARQALPLPPMAQTRSKMLFVPTLGVAAARLMLLLWRLSLQQRKHLLPGKRGERRQRQQREGVGGGRGRRP